MLHYYSADHSMDLTIIDCYTYIHYIRVFLSNGILSAGRKEFIGTFSCWNLFCVGLKGCD